MRIAEQEQLTQRSSAAQGSRTENAVLEQLQQQIGRLAEGEAADPGTIDAIRQDVDKFVRMRSRALTDQQALLDDANARLLAELREIQSAGIAVSEPADLRRVHFLAAEFSIELARQQLVLTGNVVAAGASLQTARRHLAPFPAARPVAVSLGAFEGTLASASALDLGDFFMQVDELMELLSRSVPGTAAETQGAEEFAQDVTVAEIAGDTAVAPAPAGDTAEGDTRSWSDSLRGYWEAFTNIAFFTDDEKASGGLGEAEMKPGRETLRLQLQQLQWAAVRGDDAWFHRIAADLPPRLGRYLGRGTESGRRWLDWVAQLQNTPLRYDTGPLQQTLQTLRKLPGFADTQG